MVNKGNFKSILNSVDHQTVNSELLKIFKKNLNNLENKFIYKMKSVLVFMTVIKEIGMKKI